MATYHIDQIDQKILSFLVNNARMPFLEIARECGVSGAAIHQRVKRLEANGVITGSRLLVKPQALGLNVCAFISVTLSEANKYPEVVANLKKISEIQNIPYIQSTETMISLDQAIERQVWVKDYKHTSYQTSSVKKK